MSPDEGSAASLTIVLVITILIAIAILSMITACIVLRRRKCKREQSAPHETRYSENHNPVFMTDQSDRRSSTSSYASFTTRSSNFQESTMDDNTHVY